MRGLKARTNFVYPAHQTCVLSAALAASRAASKVSTIVPVDSKRKFDWFTALSRVEPQRVLIDYNDVATVRSGAETCHDYTEVLESVERLARDISDPPRRLSNGELPQTASSMNGTTHWPRHENAALERSTRARNPEESAIANSAPETSNLLAPCSVSRESCEVYFQGLVLLRAVDSRFSSADSL